MSVNSRQTEAWLQELLEELQNIDIVSAMSENMNRETAEALLGELIVYCQSDSLSEDGLREIIERHKLTPNDIHPQISDYKFFFRACQNERVTEGIIRYLLEYFPDAASATDNDNGRTPIHYACHLKNITLNIIQLLIDAAPDSIRSVSNDGRMPLHFLCTNRKVEETKAKEITELLIEKCPEALQHANNVGALRLHPVHLACGSKSPEFCQLLIEAYPGSEQLANVHGMLPLYYACLTGTAATVEYLYKLYPGAINHTSTIGYPIHAAIKGIRHRDNPTAVVEIVKFLLDCDPDVKLQKFRGRWSLLYWACRQSYYNDSNIEAALGIIKVIYDAYPEAIEDNEITSDIDDYHPRVQAFLNGELVYSRQAKDHRLMMTPDEKGRLPLHTALHSSVSLGSVALLVKGNPSGIRCFDNSGVIPLHIACAHHDSANVIQYLLSHCETTLDTVDREGNTALHYACRGAKHDTIALLLEKYGAVSVSKRNAHKKLPIEILLGSDGVSDRESIEYTESIFRLLKAYPETLICM